LTSGYQNIVIETGVSSILLDFATMTLSAMGLYTLNIDVRVQPTRLVAYITVL
jgi:hypothetical protein